MRAIFQGVSCSSPKSCMAVGEINNGNAPMAYLWNGSKWSSTDPMVEGENSTNLFGVSCVTPDDCFAAGFYGSKNYNTPLTLVEEWNGSTWMILPKTPNPGGAQMDNLVSIYCMSATDCVAVGNSRHAGLRGGACTHRDMEWRGLVACHTRGASVRKFK